MLTFKGSNGSLIELTGLNDDQLEDILKYSESSYMNIKSSTNVSANTRVSQPTYEQLGQPNNQA
ncbi:hypothetical protein DY138_00645 [Apilactobacillus timberlakei]|uniref:hypothetical protein n=1 Tax=Apilactobacillus timberlakei TaxID=2008380 RepID=UPI00112B8DE2|nr:hypothetical protein [Apilactobacillus timberlakei]TPR19978.1 hypothetical protein DY138_00645 [Apilactobacillus timberlakei]TPR21696.1 hypothetical protein DY061_00560 [Apilactobacillus timberlakei]TPR22942.1 hypothetical protein DY083_02380 [Apilactobacillus timberlakei]